MRIFEVVWIIIQVLVGYNLVLPILVYTIIYLLRSRRQHSENTDKAEADYAIIVTAYMQTDLLPAVVNSILSVNYSNYMVYIVADNCNISDLHFDNPKVVLLQPPVTLSSNTKSHFYAIKNFVRKHERLTIVDSDNLVHPQYLREMNKYFDAGYNAVQGVREAKNLDTTYACLDAARDIYYHFYDGKILFGSGSSATLAGSGMAFTRDLYVACLQDVVIDGAGFDKVLQNKIVQRGERIAFAESAIVYDEKTANTDQLVKQRARWINTWFKYFGYGFSLIIKGVKRLNWNQFLFGFILLRPPLFIFIILSVIFMVINWWIAPLVSLVWLLAMLLFVAGFFIAMLQSYTDPKIYSSLVNIPRFMFYQVLSLLKIRKANKISVATRHSYVTKSTDR
jgi:cellulose synthase/poly-beta-1,6-N-acetylglucosamine synthase-like glycosyltransferase